MYCVAPPRSERSLTGVPQEGSSYVLPARCELESHIYSTRANGALLSRSRILPAFVLPRRQNGRMDLIPRTFHGFRLCDFFVCHSPLRFKAERCEYEYVLMTNPAHIVSTFSTPTAGNGRGANHLAMKLIFALFIVSSIQR